MGPYPSRVRRNSPPLGGPLSSQGGAGFISSNPNQRLANGIGASTPCGLPHRVGLCGPGRTRFSTSGCRSCRNMKGCRNQGWGPLLLGCGVTEGLRFHTVRGVLTHFRPPVVGVVDAWKGIRTGDGALSSTGCACSMHEPQPIRDRPKALGLPRRAGRCRSGRSTFSPTECRSCRDTEGFMIRVWDPILPGGAGSPRRRQSANASRIGVSTPCGVMSTRHNSVFVPGMSEF